MSSICSLLVFTISIKSRGMTYHSDACFRWYFRMLSNKGSKVAMRIIRHYNSREYAVIEILHNTDDFDDARVCSNLSPYSTLPPIVLQII